METDRHLIKINERAVFMSPRICPTIVRIRKSDDAGLITVIQGRSSDKSHLDQNCFPHDRYDDTLAGCLGAELRDAADNVIRSGKESRMVVVVQFVHCAEKRRTHKAGHMVPHGTGKYLSVAEQILSELVTVLLHACKEPGYRLHERVIVHDGVPLVPSEPFACIAIVFGKNERVRVDRFDRFSEFPPEIMIVILRMAQISSDVKPPSVDIVRRGSPFLSYAQDIIEQLAALLVIQLRQSGMSPPSVIKFIIRPGMLIVELKE